MYTHLVHCTRKRASKWVLLPRTQLPELSVWHPFTDPAYNEIGAAKHPEKFENIRLTQKKKNAVIIEWYIKS